MLPGFADTGVNITSDGRPYLGAAVGTREFVEEYVLIPGYLMCVILQRLNHMQPTLLLHIVYRASEPTYAVQSPTSAIS